MKFEVGQRVQHPIFGAGTVTGIKKRDGNPNLIIVKFDKGICYVDSDDSNPIPNPDRCTYKPISRCFQSITEKLTEVK